MPPPPRLLVKTASRQARAQALLAPSAPAARAAIVAHRGATLGGASSVFSASARSAFVLSAMRPLVPTVWTNGGSTRSGDFGVACWQKRACTYSSCGVRVGWRRCIRTNRRFDDENFARFPIDCDNVGRRAGWRH